MFRKVLIANRGEIAVRVAQTLQEMNISAVAVYSDPDRQALHVWQADEAYPLEGTASSETYLRGDRIIEIAQQHGVDAIHPGYGFLSENAEFAQRCADAGITFIGPKPNVIRDMGDKMVARRLLSNAGVPVVPGWSENSDDFAAMKTFADETGYPVLVKAAAGGGGKGMRVVAQASELDAAIAAAQREARSAFGDDRVFIEKYITRPRHVEIQVFGDDHGNVVHLFERECSIQRRHQKVIEESPSPALTPELRNAMGEAAVKAAHAIGYTNAGTVEFILDENGGFYFLEVNTRLQVEHPVTESVVGYDLVRVQLEVAAGGKLPFSQADLQQSGHAIECRIYAEDPDNGFVPSVGTIARFIPPIGPNIRFDSGVREGSEVTVHYDPMLAKLIVTGRTRAEAIDRAAWALRNCVVLGVKTNIEFLHDVVTHPEHRAGNLHTHFLEEHEIEAAEETSEAALIIGALATRQSRNRQTTRSGRQEDAGPWQSGKWRAF